MKIAVMGAGAVGCYFGGMLARAGHPTVLIGRRAHVDAFRAGGLHFEGLKFDEHVPVEASTEPEAVRGAQLVLFCVKSTDTEKAAAQIAPHLAADALVVNLQNGVDNTERIQSRVTCPVIPAVVYVATEMKGPGHLKHHGRGEDRTEKRTASCLVQSRNCGIAAPGEGALEPRVTPRAASGAGLQANPARGAERLCL